MKTLDLVMMAVPAIPCLAGLFGIGGSSGGLGLGGNFNYSGNSTIGRLADPFGLWNAPKPTGPTREQKESTGALLREGRLTGKTGKDLLGLFNKGEVRTGQQAEIDATKGAATASAEQFLAGAGLSDSSFGVGLRQQVDQQSAIMKEQILQGNFGEALQALNLSAADYSSIISGGQFQQQLNVTQNRDTMNAASNAMSSIFGAFGSLFGGAMGGGGGGGYNGPMPTGGNGVNSTGVGNSPGGY